MIVVHTESPAHGGASIARHDGRVIFVRGALPDENGVAVRLDNPESTKSFLTGEAVEIGVSNPHRVIPQCPAAALGAGCCDLDFVDAEGSLEFKKSVVLDQLGRIGKFDVGELVASHRIDAESMGPQTGWRTRVRFGVDEQGNVGTRMRGSRELVALSNAMCAQVHPLIREGLVSELDRLARDGKLRPNADLIVALGDDAEAHNLATTRSIIERNDTQRAPARGRKPNKRAKQTRAVLSAAELIHKNLIVDSEEFHWDLPGDAFWQSHFAASQRYADIIGQWVPHSSENNDQAWDLYGGAGVFASVLQQRVGGTVTVVDYASQATAAGQQTLPDVEFVTGDVAKSVGSLSAAEGKLHAVVLDPPRTGAGAKVIQQVAAAQPRHVVHIGCDPATAARDLRSWSDEGYDIEQVHIVDAFGLTHHVELLAHLVPRNATATDGDC